MLSDSAKGLSPDGLPPCTTANTQIDSSRDSTVAVVVLQTLDVDAAGLVATTVPGQPVCAVSAALAAHNRVEVTAHRGQNVELAIKRNLSYRHHHGTEVRPD